MQALLALRQSEENGLKDWHLDENNGKKDAVHKEKHGSKVQRFGRTAPG
jgi:hypothetical protein